MKFAIVIPTYNRVEALQRAVAHIEQQDFDESIELYCVISNTASTDGTHDYLSSLKSASGRIRYVIHSSLEKSIFLNWHKCAEIVPADIDWVWFHGDDDYLCHPQAVQFICQLIRDETDPSLTLVHACQKRRSRNTNNIIEGPLLDLCNKLGYHEMLGWMSSLVVRTDRFVAAIQRATRPYGKLKHAAQAIELRLSAYPHSAALLELCHADKALFVDAPLVDPQDDEQTQESIQRWQVERMGERYFFVIDDWLALQKKGALGHGVSRTFMRYLTYNLWDRYATFILDEVMRQKGLTKELKGYMEDVRKVSQLFKSGSDAKSYLQWYYAIEAEIMRYQQALHLTVEAEKSIGRAIQMSNVGNHDFQVLNKDGEFPH